MKSVTNTELREFQDELNRILDEARSLVPKLLDVMQVQVDGEPAIDTMIAVSALTMVQEALVAVAVKNAEDADDARHTVDYASAVRNWTKAEWKNRWK
jgi:hypothetical protein